MHLEGMINYELAKEMGLKDGKEAVLTRLGRNPFDAFNLYHTTLCSDFKTNVPILLNAIMKSRLREKIWFSQFQYSGLKVYESTGLKVREQLDVIINAFVHLKNTERAYHDIFIELVFDIPRGNANGFTYFSSHDYFREIVQLSKEERYMNYISGVGIGGRLEQNMISTHYKAKFEEVKSTSNLQILPHAGEFGDTREINCASIIDALKYSDRIGHGVTIGECTGDESLAGAVLDICITSNLKFMNKYSSPQKHPVVALFKSHKITLSSDDPGILLRNEGGKEVNIDLNSEFALFASLLSGYSFAEKIDALVTVSETAFQQVQLLIDRGTRTSAYKGAVLAVLQKKRDQIKILQVMLP